MGQEDECSNDFDFKKYSDRENFKNQEIVNSIRYTMTSSTSKIKVKSHPVGCLLE